MPLLNYKKVFGGESMGTHSAGVSIYVAVDRDLTPADEKECYRAGQDLIERLLEQSNALDEERKANIAAEKFALLGLFSSHNIYVEDIPNGYCSQYCCKDKPWFLVTTKRGRIKIGWRKHVISINWEDSLIKRSAESLFKEERTTKGDQSIHAWDYNKAGEYINTLMTCSLE
jgi:hypothetical protein